MDLSKHLISKKAEQMTYKIDDQAQKYGHSGTLLGVSFFDDLEIQALTELWQSPKQSR